MAKGIGGNVAYFTDELRFLCDGALTKVYIKKTLVYYRKGMVEESYNPTPDVLNFTARRWVEVLVPRTQYLWVLCCTRIASSKEAKDAKDAFDDEIILI